MLSYFSFVRSIKKGQLSEKKSKNETGDSCIKPKTLGSRKNEGSRHIYPQTPIHAYIRTHTNTYTSRIHTHLRMHKHMHT